MKHLVIVVSGALPPAHGKPSNDFLAVQAQICGPTRAVRTSNPDEQVIYYTRNKTSAIIQKILWDGTTSRNGAR